MWTQLEITYFFNDIDQSYQVWIFHGESLPIKRNKENVFSSEKEELDENDIDDTIWMFEAAHNYFDDKSENFEELLDAEKLLYSNVKILPNYIYIDKIIQFES